VAIVRQHGGPGASACRGRKRGQHAQAFGRSRGGFSTKIHISTDGLGNPTRFLLSGGQEADITYAEALIEGQRFEAGIGDKGYDSDRLVKRIESEGAEAVIPPKRNRKNPRAYDEHLYKERNKVERFINLMKQYRRVATRYEKTDTNFLGFIYVAAIMILLR
jgi:transposase